MSYCTKCGASVEADVQFCPSCGAAVKNTVSDSSEYNRDVEENKVYAILAYLGIPVLVPIFLAPKSRFARFHANQGLLLCAVYISVAVTWSLLSLIKVSRVRMFLGIPYVYRVTPWYITVAGILMLLGAIGLSVLGILNAVGGKEKKLPLIGDLYTILK